jgi:hypothetical protein
LLLGAPIGVDLLVYTPAERRLNRFARHALRDARSLV